MSYLDTLGVCACGMNGDGFLGWFYNLAECERRYPSTSMGMSFVNVETRSLWVYDGVAWCNTTQGSPYTMITDINNVGVVKKGYARTFYYIPNESDVRGGTITFRSIIDGEGEYFTDVDVYSISDIVLLEWTGTTINAVVRMADPHAAIVKDGKVVDRNNEVIVGKNVVYWKEDGNLVDKDGKGYRLTAVEDLRAMVQSVGQRAVDSVSYAEGQELSGAQMAQARRNIGAVGVRSMSGYGDLEYNGNVYYPTTKADYVQHKGAALSNYINVLETRINDLLSRVAELEKRQ